MVSACLGLGCSRFCLLCACVACRLQGLPLRETLQILYKIRRDKFLGEMLIFLLYFGIFMFIMLEVGCSPFLGL